MNAAKHEIDKEIALKSYLKSIVYFDKILLKTQ